VQRVRLVFLLGLLVLESHVQRDLIALLDHRTMARLHFAGVKLKNAGDGFQIFIRPGN
jgi:hypothetical protein